MKVTPAYTGSPCKWRFGLLLLLLLFTSEALQAQDFGQADSLQGGRQNQIANQPKQEGQVNFQSADSLIFVFEEDRIATLYGSASVTHASGQLKAGKVALNLDKALVKAQTQTPQDTLSQPVLIRENNRVRSNSISYNYETEKGRFEVARIQVQDGNLIGKKVKKTAPEVIFLEDAIYSTCLLDHPHYYIKADRMKVVDREKVFFTHARLYILDIPYPLVFPFGYLPGKFNRKQSGILAPTYAFQAKQTRGLGLQNLGWFQYFNDYLTAQASVDIFTSGTFFLDTRANYRVRDQYSGSISFGYSHERGLEPTDPGFLENKNTQKRIAINHSQQFSPYASLNANINLRTSDYFDRNSYDPELRSQTSTNSNINYRYRHPGGLYNFDISIRQNQNFVTNVTRLSGPDFNFNLQRFSPFHNELTTGSESKWYESLSIDYDNSFNSEYHFDPLLQDSAQINWFEALLDPAKYRQATGNDDYFRYAFRQNVNISMNDLLPSEFLNTRLGLTYHEYWFPASTRRVYLPDSNEVVTRKVQGFSTARDFSTSFSFSTTLFGLFNANIGSFSAFRHKMTPSISLSYQPDFSSDFWGYYRTVQVDSTGRTQRYSIFEDQLFSGPGANEQWSLRFSLGNTFEAKQVKRDSTGEVKENIIRLIDNLDFSTSYNFAADSIKLSNLNVNLGANILPGMRIRADAQFNFYERNEQGQKVDDFLLTTSGRLFEMTGFSFQTSYAFEWGEQGIQINDDPYYPLHYDPLNQHIFGPVDPHFNDRPIQDFNSPFSFSLDFNYSWNLRPGGESSTRAVINADNISLRLTPKWYFNTEIGYDFVRGELTPSQFSLRRDLHCWSLSFTMNPFGEDKYYFFSLTVDAGRLSSIFQKLPILRNMKRSSSPTGRAPIGF
ncbi:MAG TPA: putative LPS assembly protein LptD [Balneolaceae bacterium]|nr:putative LPS assembly protein LptD [Balneolaceae bacterium]